MIDRPEDRRARRVSWAFVLACGLITWNPDSTRAAEEISLRSPDGDFELELSLDRDGRPTYRVERNDIAIIAPSGLGFRLPDDVDWTRGFDRLELVKRDAQDSTWKPVWGERATIRDRYKSLRARFHRKSPPVKLDLEIRAYDEGIAFRYVIDHSPTPGETEIEIESEETQFRFTADHPLWAVYSAQGRYTKTTISKIQHSVERPCVLEPEKGPVIAIAEAALVDYARMRLRRSESLPDTLISRLHGRVKSKLPLSTPWRVVLAADEAGDLLENNHLILNLNEPCKLDDTSWIRPGKVLREVSLSTEGGKACVDFAVRYGLQYIEYDAGWYGPEREESSDARTVSRRGLDLRSVIGYARERGIGVLVYVNRRHLETQLDELLPLYKSWGIAGIKYGFVQHGSQKWTAWLHDAIRKTAQFGLLVDVHDEYRMTGWERTYPNFMTAEGIGGDETRPPNEQALVNLFTRMICGPADHTFCYYNGYVDRTTSHAAQLAKMIMFFSPLQFLFWYDRPSNASDEPELELIRHLPTTWDETRVLKSKIGQYGVIARRGGVEWFVGCLNAGEPRKHEISLSFLPRNESFDAFVYRDDSSVSTRTKVRVVHRVVTSNDAIIAEVNERQGVAIRLVPRRGSAGRQDHSRAGKRPGRAATVKTPGTKNR